MQIASHPREISSGGRAVCLAIGMFDGVHLGHQQVIRQSQADAHQHEGLSIVVTFDRHPNAIVAPQKSPPLIYSLPQKLRVLTELGIDAILLLPFDEEFSRQTGESFVRWLVSGFGGLSSLAVGHAFTFGYKRSGNVALLKKMGTELDFLVHDVSALSLDGRIVSSTRIRQLVASGDFDNASQMLGRPYSVAATIVPGSRLGGQRLKTPTINLDTHGLVLPPSGVYATHVRIKDKVYRAVANIGCRPTVTAGSNPSPRLEAHLLDFNGNLYRHEAEIVFVHKLREEKRFSSLDALRQQIQRDISAARNLFSGAPPAKS